MYHFSENHPLILDLHMANKTENFYSTDSESIYEKNKLIHGKNWYYRNSTIEYKFNSLGYRTKEIHELQNDFVLTFGCSYTEGVGLPTHELWPTKLANLRGTDLYNAAKQATGIDFQHHNALRWSNATVPDPKLVIVQWPYKTRKRFGFIQEDGTIGLGDETGSKSIDGKWWERRYVIDQGELQLNILTWIEGFNNIWKLKGVPVLNFTWDDDLVELLASSKYMVYHIPITPESRAFRARDIVHDGIGVHDETTEYLYKCLQLPNFTFKV